ncbi:MAG: hypothetical protein HY719_08885 [Planctomycetes bacterium]|nr:hypothetical protein [Planctomycetota bacterium]
MTPVARSASLLRPGIRLGAAVALLLAALWCAGGCASAEVFYEEELLDSSYPGTYVPALIGSGIGAVVSVPVAVLMLPYTVVEWFEEQHYAPKSQYTGEVLSASARTGGLVFGTPAYYATFRPLRKPAAGEPKKPEPREPWETPPPEVFPPPVLAERIRRLP